MLATWLSYDDLERLVVSSLTAPVVGHSVIYGLCDNTVTWWDNTPARHIGYRPQDSSEPFRAAVEARQAPLDLRDPATLYQGGGFVRQGPLRLTHFPVQLTNLDGDTHDDPDRHDSSPRAAAGAAGWPGPDRARDRVPLRRHAQRDDYPTVAAVKHMSELLDKTQQRQAQDQGLQQGRLGSEKETIDQVKIGALDLTRVNVGPMNYSAR